MNEKNTMKILDNYGNKTEYEILYTFTLSTTNKNYIIYTDNTENKEGKLNIYASIYNKNSIENIETEEEWKEVERILLNSQDKK